MDSQDITKSPSHKTMLSLGNDGRLEEDQDIDPNMMDNLGLNDDA